MVNYSMPGIFPLQKINDLLQSRAGVTLNGPAPHDIQVHANRFYRDVVLKGGLGFGEGYVRGDWDVADLFALKVQLYRAALTHNLTGYFSFTSVFSWFREKLFSLSRKKARCCVRSHYDLGNAFYHELLGETMQYTSAYFSNASMGLDEAQRNKFSVVADKLRVFPGCHILELGCGWGVFAKYLAEEHGCRVTAVTLSREQYTYCVEHNSRPLQGSVAFFCNDFRDTNVYMQGASKGPFDRIVGIGTIAHFASLFRHMIRVLHENLKDGGLVLIDDVCRDVTCRPFHPSQSPWISQYIFPGTRFFSPDQIVRFFKKRLTIERWDSDRHQYRDTCLAWLQNLESRWESITRLGDFDERFLRIWRYYLTSAAAGFEAGYLGQWQIVLSKMTSPYRPPTLH